MYVRLLWRPAHAASADATRGACRLCLNGAGGSVTGSRSRSKPRRRTTKDGEDALLLLVVPLFVLVLVVVALVAVLAVVLVSCSDTSKCNKRHQHDACCHAHDACFTQSRNT
jgi:hypothetical protein